MPVAATAPRRSPRMPRKGPAPRRELMPDPIYRSVLVTQIVNKVLVRGKRSTAERIVYTALEPIEETTGAAPLATLNRAIENIKPPRSEQRRAGTGRGDTRTAGRSTT